MREQPRAEINAGELDCMTALWSQKQPLRASDILGLITERRERTGEAPPAPTTVSTYMRSLLAKGLVREVTMGRRTEGEPKRVYARGTRGMIPSLRSPKTGYEPTTDRPGEVLQKTYCALADAYPLEQRWQAVADFSGAAELPEAQRVAALAEVARVLGFAETTVKKLEKLVEQSDGSGRARRNPKRNNA
jgi:hypothetical protein